MRPNRSELCWRVKRSATTWLAGPGCWPPTCGRPGSIKAYICCWPSWPPAIKLSLVRCVLFQSEGVNPMDFRPLNDTERRNLITALRGNADRGLSLLMDRRDTSFLGAAEEVPDEEVINAIKSVPCHY